MTKAANQRATTAIHPKLEKHLAAYFAAAGAAGVGVLALTQSADEREIYVPKDSDQKPRRAARINPKLDKKLATYVAVAGAAGVAFLAAAPAAEAKVVYTPANTRLYNSSFALDLNNDGVSDLSLIASFQGFSFYQTMLHVSPAAGNAVIGVAGGAADLPWGARIGPTGAFDSATQLMASRQRCQSSYCYAGPWVETQNRFLGIKFSINGQTHYGWARLSVGRLPATLTGYAYETIPNKPIIAGRTSVPVEVSGVNPVDAFAPAYARASLALLARGAESLSIWRRDEDVKQ
jgi:hypothetical protein